MEGHTCPGDANLRPHWHLYRARAMVHLRRQNSHEGFCTNELSLALYSGRKWPSPLSASQRGHSCLQEHKAIEDIRNSNEQGEQTTKWTQDWTQEAHHRLTLHRSQLVPRPFNLSFQVKVCFDVLWCPHIYQAEANFATSLASSQSKGIAPSS